MCWLEDLFWDIAAKFWYWRSYMLRTADYFADTTSIPWLEGPFRSMADLCLSLNEFFEDVAREVGNWWDNISGISSDLNNLWNYAYGWLRDKAVAAYDMAMTAYAWADAALEAAQSALQEIPDWIVDKLNLAYNLASTALQEIPAWITTQLGDLQGGLDSLWNYAQTTVWNKAVDAWNYAANAWSYAEDLFAGLWSDVTTWVNNIPASIGNFVDNAIDTVRTWAADQLDAAISSLASSIAAPINLVNLWFNSIQEFFNDPLEWLWNKFTDWFLGPE